MNQKFSIGLRGSHPLRRLKDQYQSGRRTSVLRRREIHRQSDKERDRCLRCRPNVWFLAWLQLAKRIEKCWKSWQLSCRWGTSKRLCRGGDKLHLIHAGLCFLRGGDYQVWSFRQWWSLQIRPVRRRWWVLWPKFQKSQKHLLALQRQIGRAGMSRRHQWLTRQQH